MNRVIRENDRIASVGYAYGESNAVLELIRHAEQEMYEDKNLYYSEETPYYNMNYYSNSDLDAMVDEANVITATDRDAAVKIYSDAQKLILDDCVSIFAYDIDNVWVTNKTFQGHVDNAAYPDVVFFYDCYRGE